MKDVDLAYYVPKEINILQIMHLLPFENSQNSIVNGLARFTRWGKVRQVFANQQQVYEDHIIVTCLESVPNLFPAQLRRSSKATRATQNTRITCTIIINMISKSYCLNPNSSSSAVALGTKITLQTTPPPNKLKRNLQVYQSTRLG